MYKRNTVYAIIVNIILTVLYVYIYKILRKELIDLFYDYILKHEKNKIIIKLN